VLEASSTLNDQTLRTTAAYSNDKGYHHIQPVSGNYACNDKFLYIRVGNDQPCPDSKLYCNGPLKSSETYRVKFVEIDGTALKGQSQWSPAIKLLTVTNSSRIDTWPGRRSGAMIVITSILSVLLAILFAGLVAAIIIGCKGIPSPKLVEKEKEPLPQGIDMRNYVTHHSPEVYDEILLDRGGNAL
uniref:Uroplakin 3A n=1 Tax=Leptobrachium leishanense TaxID=445787 RepID=A0A8C5Q546_9ANUR